MEFHINKNGTLPLLKMALVNNGRYDFNKYYEILQKSKVTFSMKNILTGKYVILNKEAMILSDEEVTHTEKYYIAYQFSSRETKMSGNYIGEFKIIINEMGANVDIYVTDTKGNPIEPHGEGTLIVPIHDELKVVIH